MVEIKLALSKLGKCTAPGPDQIHNKMLISLPMVTLVRVQNLFNESLKQAILPLGWKKSKIIMLRKKAENINDPTNYRPISLTSCLGKLLERIICARIMNFLKPHIGQGAIRFQSQKAPSR